MKPTATLPNRVDSNILSRFRQGDEPMVIVKLIGVGNTSPYDFRDKGGRSYIFKWESTLSGHIVRIPLSVWMADGSQNSNKAKIAHDVMDQRHMSHSMVILLEMPAVIAKYDGPAVKEQEATPVNTSPTEMGATDTSEEVRNVVGPDEAPTVAPAVEPIEDKTCYASEDERDEAERRYRESLPEVAEVQPPASKPEVNILDAAYALVEPPKRIKALAALIGVEESVLRDAIALPESKVELAAAGWVRRKA